MRLVDVYSVASGVILYRLLRERPKEANISHRGMPVWIDHLAFIESRPYEAWYLIMGDSEVCGAVYLTKQGEIGISLFEKHRKKGIAREAIEALMNMHPRKRYLANIAPGNEPSTKLFEALGFRHIQNTFEKADV